MCLQVVKGGGFYSSLFAPRNRFLRRTEFEALFASYLDKNQEITVLGDYIDFTTLAAIVGL